MSDDDEFVKARTALGKLSPSPESKPTIDLAMRALANASKLAKKKTAEGPQGAFGQPPAAATKE